MLSASTPYRDLAPNRLSVSIRPSWAIPIGPAVSQGMLRGSMTTSSKPQLLHLVFGGELTDLDGVEFRDLEQVHIVGIFPDYASAHAAWKAAAQRTVDNAMMRYFIVHLHRLLDPRLTGGGSAPA